MWFLAGLQGSTYHRIEPAFSLATLFFFTLQLLLYDLWEFKWRRAITLDNWRRTIALDSAWRWAVALDDCCWRRAIALDNRGCGLQYHRWCCNCAFC
jgi:hypothetical protein